jgi:RNA polymerase sigma-70 factor (TIGR02960 family)
VSVRESEHDVWWKGEVVSTELVARARAGDGSAFRELTEPHRRELHVHCYRMLGSFQDAEDALQDTLRSTSRRPAKEWDVPQVEPPTPSRLGEIVWLEPYSQHLLEASRGPEARYEQTEAVSLAFVTASQVLPARQRAVLILREVLGYHADEVAEMLGSTVESVTSALKRARAGLQRHPHEPPPAPGSPAEQALVAKFVSAYSAGDVDALVALLTADVHVSMPPIPLEYHGRDDVARFCTGIIRHRAYDLVPARANGQPAFATYLRDQDSGRRHGAGLLVLTLAGDRIRALTRFGNDVLPSFGLPRSLPG